MSNIATQSPLVIGVVRETIAGEHRVALVPEIAHKLTSAGITIVMQRSAGAAAQFPDSLFKNVEFVDSALDVFERANLLLKVQPLSLV